MSGYDVLVVGEVLVELSSPLPLEHADSMALSFSGDAFNAAAAAAAAGASVGVLTRIGDDELGAQILRALEERDIDTALVRRTAAPNGVYFVSADPAGARDFVYVRRQSAASELGPDDVAPGVVSDAGALVVSGIAQALSESCAAAIARAAELGRAGGARVVYDPNFRDRLTDVETARAAFDAIAPFADVVTPSCPGDTHALLDTTDAREAAAACRARGARAAAVTRGANGVLLDDGEAVIEIAALPAPALVDATGAGDIFTGTLAARLALGDPLVDAARLGAAAAALSVSAQGGAGRVATLDAVRRHLAAGADRRPAGTAKRAGA